MWIAINIFLQKLVMMVQQAFGVKVSSCVVQIYMAVFVEPRILGLPELVEEYICM
jgi:hypothetical protein